MSNNSLEGSSYNPLKDNEKKDTIPCRIDIIKELLKGKKLEALINFDNTDTDQFYNRKNDNESGESYDTRVVLKKRFFGFSDIITQIGGKLKYIKSGTTGHTFKGEILDNYGSFEYGVKVVAYPKKERYGDFTDIRRPENAEIMMIKLLSYFVVKKQTPHIVLPIGTFDTKINTFVNLINENIIDGENSKYNSFIRKHNEGLYHDKVSILISEWANRGDLLDFIRKNYKYFTSLHWKVIFFQILSVLAVIQSKYPAFRHNDLKANNILVHKILKRGERFTYKVARLTYKVPNIGYHIKLWDFDFACIAGVVDNKKVESKWAREEINVTPEQNRYYDVHYFFNTLIKKGFCGEIIASDHVPSEVREFIGRIVPKKYQRMNTEFVNKKNARIMINDEYITPNEILKNDPYFAEFRTNNDVNVKNQVKLSTVKSTPNIVSKFFTSDSSSDEINKNTKSKITNNVPKNMPKNKNSKQKIGKKKSKTISDEIRDFDPNKILINTSSSS